MPKVSVVMACYNHEKYVAEAIRGVIDQTFSDWELIIVDDASPDKSVDVIRSFTDPRIRFYPSKVNRGPSATVNDCLSRVTGEYISFLPSDDAYLPLKLEKQVKFLDENPEYMACFCQPECINENSEVISHPMWEKFAGLQYKTRAEFLRHFFYKGNFLNGPGELIRKSAMDQVGGFSPVLLQLQDFDHHVRKAVKGSIYLSAEKLVRYRIRDNEMNLSAPRPATLIRDSVEWMQVYDNYLEINDYPLLLEAFPDIKNFGPADNNLCNFYMARLAASINSRTAQLWADGVFFRILKNEAMRDYILEKTGFSLRDFFNILGTNDVFNVTNKSLNKKKVHRLKKLVRRFRGK